MLYEYDYDCTYVYTVRCGADGVVLIGYWNGMVGGGGCAPVQACAPFHVVQVHKLSTDRD